VKAALGAGAVLPDEEHLDSTCVIYEDYEIKHELANGLFHNTITQFLVTIRAKIG